MLKETEQYTTDPWMNYMLQGRWDQAWKISDLVLKERAGKPCWHLPRHQQYIWDGSSLEGKRVLVRCYHGLGRYHPVYPLCSFDKSHGKRSDCLGTTFS